MIDHLFLAKSLINLSSSFVNFKYWIMEISEFDFTFPNVVMAFEEIVFLHNRAAPESLPYVFKYKAREVINFIMKNEEKLQNCISEQLKSIGTVDSEHFSKNSVHSELYFVFISYLHYLLAQNYLESEENNFAEKNFKLAIENFSKLEFPNFFIASIIECYNSLGFLYINRDENHLGLSILKKAEILYLENKQENGEKCENWLLNALSTATDYKPFFIGEFSKEKLESQHTLTLFYLAQGFTKLEARDLGAKYCGATMKRQFETGNYELKDFSVNCISLSEYYDAQENFAQSYYLILAGISLLPEEGKRKKLRATLQMSLGRVVGSFMNFAISILGKNTDLGHINNKIITFEGIKVEYPTLKCPSNLDEIKSLFRQSHTQFKKALEYFKLDGYVTEHIEILKEISSLYKSLSTVDPQKLFAYFDKRKELLEPILTLINPKAYSSTWLEIAVEVAEITGGMFDLRVSDYVSGKFAKKPAKVLEMNSLGEKTISYYKTLLQRIESEKESSQNLLSSEINARFTIAKTFSHLQPLSKEEKVEALKSSLYWYKSIVDLENKVSKEKIEESNMAQQFVMCKEMVEMLPLKIEKIIH